MKDQLPNLRLIGLESSERGRDWSELTQKIDQKIEDHGFELTTQDIFIEFKEWPSLPKVMVYRSIIGPLKEMEAPFIITDWESSAIERMDLSSHEWHELFAEISHIRSQMSVGSDFVIVFSRRLAGELNFNKQVLFR